MEAWAPSGVNIWGDEVPSHALRASLSDLSVLSPQNLSSNGYPASLRPDQALGTLMARDVAQRIPSGRYVVTYEGDADLSFGMDARVVPGSERKGRLELDVALSPASVLNNGIYLQVE